MRKTCRHCYTRFSASKGHGEFCCAGCEHVYSLIQKGGLGDYYKMQDRVGRPIFDSPFQAENIVLVKQLQDQVESEGGYSKVSFGVQGLSCMGCVWLIEQLAKHHRGVRSVKVALSSHRISLAWNAGEFDLADFAAELQNFGYRLSPHQSVGPNLSPLSIRLLLSLIFCANGLFLTLISALGLSGEDLSQLFSLLIMACFFFGLMIGAPLYFVPAWRGLRLRRFHSDLLPSLSLLGLSLWFVATLLRLGDWWLSASLFFLALPVFVFARWLSEIWILRLGRN
ncbi:MAG: heavy metal translocating P-type ATPase metal-binding domain-containing protein [Verrucomicrobiota bacterium]